VILTDAAQEFASVSPISPRSTATANPNASAHVCSPKPSDARSNHLGRPDPHHLPALAWSPLSFLCAVTVAHRRSRVVAMVTPPPYRPTDLALTPVCTLVRPCLVQPRAHARARAQPRNHACACLERSRLSLWLPFAPDLVGTPSRHGTRLCCRGKSFLPGSASANSIPFLRTRAPTRPSPSTPRVKPKHPDRDHLVALLHLAAEDVLPPGRMTVRPSQCACPSTRTHAGEHHGVPPRSSPLWPSHRHAYALK
jgi:hypothetical protein